MLKIDKAAASQLSALIWVIGFFFKKIVLSVFNGVQKKFPISVRTKGIWA